MRCPPPGVAAADPAWLRPLHGRVPERGVLAAQLPLSLRHWTRGRRRRPRCVGARAHAHHYTATKEPGALRAIVLRACFRGAVFCGPASVNGLLGGSGIALVARATSPTGASTPCAPPTRHALRLSGPLGPGGRPGSTAAAVRCLCTSPILWGRQRLPSQPPPLYLCSPTTRSVCTRSGWEQVVPSILPFERGGVRQGIDDI